MRNTFKYIISLPANARRSLLIISLIIAKIAQDFSTKNTKFNSFYSHNNQ